MNLFVTNNKFEASSNYPKSIYTLWISWNNTKGVNTMLNKMTNTGFVIENTYQLEFSYIILLNFITHSLLHLTALLLSAQCTHPSGGSRAMDRGPSRFAHRRTFLAVPSRRDISMRLVPVSVQ